MPINPDFHCFLNLFTGDKLNDAIYGIEATFCDHNFNVLSNYYSPLDVYEQKYLGYVINAELASKHHREHKDTINGAFNIITNINDIDCSLRFNKSEDTSDIATTLFWTDTRKNHLYRYNDLIHRICDKKDIDPYEFQINVFLGRCYNTIIEGIKLL